MPREILVDWTTDAGGGQLSVFHFDSTGPVATQRTDLNTFLGSVDDILDSGTTWTIRTTGRELDDATGALTGIWSETTPYTGTGGTVGNQAPDAAQALVRWDTGVIVSGRVLKGRTFLPGVGSAQIVQGNLQASAVATLVAAAGVLAAAGSQLSIWHRPVGGAGGVRADVVAGSAWNEVAVLRRRRK